MNLNTFRNCPSPTGHHKNASEYRKSHLPNSEFYGWEDPLTPLPPFALTFVVQIRQGRVFIHLCPGRQQFIIHLYINTIYNVKLLCDICVNNCQAQATPWWWEGGPKSNSAQGPQKAWSGTDNPFQYSCHRYVDLARRQTGCNNNVLHLNVNHAPILCSRNQTDHQTGGIMI